MAWDVFVIVLFGFKQFRPVCENFCGPVPDGLFEKSDMLWEMCDGQMLTMEINKRSDLILFNFFTKLTDHYIPKLWYFENPRSGVVRWWLGSVTKMCHFVCMTSYTATNKNLDQC